MGGLTIVLCKENEQFEMDTHVRACVVQVNNVFLNPFYIVVVTIMIHAMFHST